MVIPIPGPISDDDMAFTRSVTTPPTHKPKLPFLYDFEGREGNLDFLTRVVVLTFYPSESTTSPVTIGEVHYVFHFLVFYIFTLSYVCVFFYIFYMCL